MSQKSIRNQQPDRICITNCQPQPQSLFYPVFGRPLPNPPPSNPPSNPPPSLTPILTPSSPVFNSTPAHSSSQAQIFIDAHNNFRNNTRPPAINMKPLQWSDSLQRGSEDWARKCKWGHSQTPRVGENLYVTSKRSPNSNVSSFDPTEAVNSWGNEQIYYDYDRNKCEPGKVCGHYTQVVWADTDQVGCAVQDCPQIDGLNFPNGGTLVVCQYSPPGNYVGQKPYQTH